MKKKILKWGLLVIGIIAALILSIYAIFDVASGSKLRTVLAERKARGEPMSFNELVKQTQQENNAADSYAQIFKLMTSGTYDQKTGSAKVNKKFSVASDAYSRKAYLKLSSQNKKALEEFLGSEDSKTFFNLIDKAINKPVADFNLDYSQGFELLMPHLSLLRDSIRIICAKALFDANKGNTDAAYAYIIKGLMMSRQMDNEPVFLTFLVRLVCDNMLMRAALDIMKENGISTAMSEKLISELYKHIYHDHLNKAMDGEVLMISALFESMINDKYSFEKFKKMIDIDKKTSSIFLNKAFLKNDYATFLQVMSEMKSYLNNPVNKEYDRRINNIPSYCILTGMLTSSYRKAKMKILQADSMNAYLVTYSGIINYKNKFSEYPAKLENLCPKILTEIPVDSMTGKCFSYTSDGKGFELKSEDREFNDKFINSR